MEKKPVFFEGLDKITEIKSLYKLSRIQETLKELGDEINPNNQKYWVPYLKNLLDSETFIYLNRDWKEYKKDYPKSDYADDILKAKNNDSKLFRIIKWDKTWLFVDWVQWKILDAQEKGDLIFLKKLGEAIAKKPQTTKLLRGKDLESRRLILRFCESVINESKIKFPKMTISKAIEIILWSFQKVEAKWIPEKLFDRDYLKKYLKRHKIILSF